MGMQDYYTYDGFERASVVICNYSERSQYITNTLGELVFISSEIYQYGCIQVSLYTEPYKLWVTWIAHALDLNHLCLILYLLHIKLKK